MTVLVIEDDTDAAAAMRVMLTLHGCEVVQARTLEQGIDLLRALPAVVITDLMLPDGDGIEILTRVREGKMPVKVAVTTAIGDTRRLAAVRALRPDWLFHKPVDLDELVRELGVTASP